MFFTSFLARGAQMQLHEVLVCSLCQLSTPDARQQSFDPFQRELAPRFMLRQLFVLSCLRSVTCLSIAEFSGIGLWYSHSVHDSGCDRVIVVPCSETCPGWRHL